MLARLLCLAAALVLAGASANAHPNATPPQPEIAHLGFVAPDANLRYAPSLASSSSATEKVVADLEASIGRRLYAQQRYYDPQIGRFLSVDPMASDTSSAFNFNRYAYAQNSPYRYTDPDGRCPTCDRLSDAMARDPQAFNNPLHQVPAVAITTVMVALTGGPRAAMAFRELMNRKPAEPTVSAADRAKELHSLLNPRAQRSRTTAVTETAEGTRIVSSSERRLSPAQREQLKPNEVEGVGKGHAETTGIQAAKDKGLTPTGTAASRGICSECAARAKADGVTPLSPLKE
jgi:RHS repeat-associated protein